MPRILIIDDDDCLRKIYARYLTPAGFEVLEAANSEEALLKFRENNLDVVLLDIRMPTVKHGPVLIPALQQSHPHAKIIISSCYDLDFQKEAFRNAAGYFNKAEGCAALLSKIQAVLSENPVRRVRPANIP